MFLPTVYQTPSNRKTNTEYMSPTTGISMMWRLWLNIYIYFFLIIILFLPTVYLTPSNEKTNTEDTSLTIGISVTYRLWLLLKPSLLTSLSCKHLLYNGQLPQSQLTCHWTQYCCNPLHTNTPLVCTTNARHTPLRQ